MKVLWFSNTPANADEYFNLALKGSGGWLKSLDSVLQELVELHIAFEYDHKKIFTYNKSTYYPISINTSKFKRILNRWFPNVFFVDNLQVYLDIINIVQPDIIHIHGTESSFTDIIPHVNIPVVVSLQGNITIIKHKFLSGIERKFLKISNRNVNSLKEFLFPFRFCLTYKKFKIMQNREQFNLPKIKYIIGRTSWDRRISSILSPDRTYYHGDEILRNFFYNHTWEYNQRSPFIIHTTNGNSYYKGFETLCYALTILNNYGFNCEWHVAGIHENDLIVKIVKKLLKNNYPTKNLVLLGKLDENDLVSKLLETDVYVMPSHIENSPNNLCEAMLLGMPCISTFVGGVGSLLKDNEEGLLIQEGDPWSMAGAIIEIAQNKEKAISMAKNARSSALIRHDKKLIVEALINTYKCIIERNNNFCEK